MYLTLRAVGQRFNDNRSGRDANCLTSTYASDVQQAIAGGDAKNCRRGCKEKTDLANDADMNIDSVGRRCQVSAQFFRVAKESFGVVDEEDDRLAVSLSLVASNVLEHFAAEFGVS